MGKVQRGGGTWIDIIRFPMWLAGLCASRWWEQNRSKDQPLREDSQLFGFGDLPLALIEGEEDVRAENTS